MSIRVTSEAVQLHGGYGFTDEYLVSRLYRGARYGSLGGGASETLRDLVGKKIVTDSQRGDGIVGLGDDLDGEGEEQIPARYIVFIGLRACC